MSDEVKDDGDEFDGEESVFVAWLREHHDGQTLRQLDETLRDVIGGVQQWGKVGTLAFKVKAEQQGRTIAIVTEITSKVPGEPATADIFFPDRDGGLHRHDPFQQKFDLSNVVKITTDSGEVKTVDATTGEVKKVETKK